VLGVVVHGGAGLMMCHYMGYHVSAQDLARLVSGRPGEGGGTGLLTFGGSKPPLIQALECSCGNRPGLRNHARGPD